MDTSSISIIQLVISGLMGVLGGTVPILINAPISFFLKKEEILYEHKLDLILKQRELFLEHKLELERIKVQSDNKKNDSSV